MTPLAAQADQAVRHAVDAYIDGRFLPTFEGEAAFETRNSRYELRDGVLHVAPDASLVGAELVGWLIEYTSRAEVVSAWKSGARAVLVDTRNDGVRGPHIVVTSATRSFRAGRSSSPPRWPAPPSPTPAPGSRWTQGGSTVDQSWGRPAAAPVPPARVSPSWGHAPAATPPPAPPPPMKVRPATPLPPPPYPPPVPPPAYGHSDPSFARRIEAAIEACGTSADDEDAVPTARDERRHGAARLSEGATSRAPAPPRAESAPFMLTGARARAHQRGVPLR